MTNDHKECRVVVSDIHMSFWSMVVFLVKGAFAAIPALLIVAMVWVFLLSTIAGFFKYR